MPTICVCVCVCVWNYEDVVVFVAMLAAVWFRTVLDVWNGW